MPQAHPLGLTHLGAGTLFNTGCMTWGNTLANGSGVALSLCGQAF